MSEERRTVHISVKMTPTEHAALQQMARDEGRSKSQIVCRLVVKDAKAQGMWPEEASDDR